MAEAQTRCPICGAPGRHVGTKHGYVITRCTSCAHSFVADQPSTEELRQHYEYERGLQNVPDFVFPILRSVLRRFEPYRTTGRLLDVGFGAGALLRVASEAGWDAHGIEIAHAAVEAAREARIGAKLVEGDFLVYPYEPRSFDVIVFDGIVANLPEPLAFFTRAHEVLRPGGLLYVTTPHGRGLTARVLGTSWSALAPPEHLHLFSARSIALAARGAGFTAARTYTRGLNPLELIKVFRGSATPPRGLAVNAALVRTGSGRVLKHVANAVLRSTNLGDQLYLEARA